eukprot:Plantae.Rhodophyta-Purpureofilum_apyrenoidigerum.ctg19652.p1 GENE.Plantae.Rhodophyta-Purpureofilum_apyrenoidigerum.ctg19652~~Plantae.Rhodophyta-Purpureofilum_apyrenoidigerum.ctg19652.p1  ORF type:complete len:281 (+),score=44.73 Plantae.Rhodophyta-Purpureofilum_apyrenoidigerum.ctg19652:255-1097(+)
MMGKGELTFDLMPPLEKSLSRGLSRGLSRSSTISKEMLGNKRSKSKNLFQCPVENCGRVFDRKYNMQIHIRKHTGEMPYQCRVEGCGVRFKWRSSLVNHNRKHKTGELPGPPDPTLEVKVRSSRENGGMPSPFEHELMDRQTTEPCFVELEDYDNSMSYSNKCLQQTVQSTSTAGDLFVCAGNRKQSREYYEQPCTQSYSKPPTSSHQSFDLTVEQLFKGQSVFAMNSSFATAVQETTVDNDFIDRFNGALTCEFDAQIIEEVLDNHFASPISEEFQDPL